MNISHMSNALNSLPSGTSGQIQCHYVNVTQRLQIIRIENIPSWYFERVIFPGQSLIFHTLPDALLEVHSYEMVTALLVERIPCEQIRCVESVDLSSLTRQKQPNSLQAA